MAQTLGLAVVAETGMRMDSECCARRHGGRRQGSLREDREIGNPEGGNLSVTLSRSAGHGAPKSEGSPERLSALVLRVGLAVASDRIVSVF